MEANDFAGCDAGTLWGWLTGGYEDETNKSQKAVVADKANLSHRRYEKLFMTSTDALAVYSSGDLTEENYQRAMYRAAQLFEHCILVRRLLRNEAGRASKLFRRVGWRSVPVVASVERQANSLLDEVTRAELDLVKASPVRSGEAQRLVDQALKDFGIPDLINVTRNSYQLLDRRVRWIRAQWLAVVAIGVFFVNTFFHPHV